MNQNFSQTDNEQTKFSDGSSPKDFSDTFPQDRVNTYEQHPVTSLS
jgi:hypothetical protein